MERLVKLSYQEITDIIGAHLAARGLPARTIEYRVESDLPGGREVYSRITNITAIAILAEEEPDAPATA